MNKVNLNSGSENKSSGTDWDWLANAEDDQIDYSDIPPLGESFFQQAQLRLRSGSKAFTVRVDADLLAWFKAQENGFEQSINAALRSYAESNRS